jgi:hypothetical protein
MREVLAVTAVSLMTGALFGVAGTIGAEKPPPPKPGITGLEQARTP